MSVPQPSVFVAERCEPLANLIVFRFLPTRFHIRLSKPSEMLLLGEDLF